MKRNKALVVGSVAYDIVFEVHNILKDEIIIENNLAKSVSMMLTAKNKKVFFGGTGGNIAYGLGIQKESPLLFSVVGDDFNNDYRKHLIDNGVDLRVVTKNNEHTATFYAISDQVKDQIGIFQPNTHGDYMDVIKLTDTLTQDDFDAIKIAIFSPGQGISTRNHMQQLRKAVGNKVKIIFDPSQVLSIFFDEPLLNECLKMADIFIGNETEVAQLTTLMNMNVEKLLKMGLEYVIETRGSQGVLIHSKDKVISIPAEKPARFVEQTGAGDAFRAGMIKGLLNDLDIKKACEIGARMGALNVAEEGGQKYILR